MNQPWVCMCSPSQSQFLFVTLSVLLYVLWGYIAVTYTKFMTVISFCIITQYFLFLWIFSVLLHFICLKNYYYCFVFISFLYFWLFWVVYIQFSSVQFSHSVLSDSLWPHEPQHARPPCPSPVPGVHPNPRLSSGWCHPTVSSSVVPFSSCPQSFPSLGSFPMSQLFTSGGHIGASASSSVIPMSIQRKLRQYYFATY